MRPRAKTKDGYAKIDLEKLEKRVKKATDAGQEGPRGQDHPREGRGLQDRGQVHAEEGGRVTWPGRRVRGRGDPVVSPPSRITRPSHPHPDRKPCLHSSAHLSIILVSKITPRFLRSVGRLRGEPSRTGPTMIPAFEFHHPMTTLQTAPRRDGEIRQQRAVQPHRHPAVREDLRRALRQHGRACDHRGPLRPARVGAAARGAGAGRRQRHRRRRVPPGAVLRRQGHRDRPGRGDGRHRQGAGRATGA